MYPFAMIASDEHAQEGTGEVRRECDEAKFERLLIRSFAEMRDRSGPETKRRHKAEHAN